MRQLIVGHQGNYGNKPKIYQTLSIAGASAVKVTVTGGLDGIGDNFTDF